jgi:enoyl-CoA hydratase/carnithine racemase
MNADARDDGQLPHIIVEERSALAVICINRPAQRNSLSVTTLNEIEQAFARLTQNDRLEAIIFTGTGEVFVFASGADIRELCAPRHHHRLGRNSKIAATRRLGARP